jgi:hypothetical protein
MEPTGPPPNPRVGRQRFLVAYLRIAVLAVFLLGVVALVLPDDAYRPFAVTMAIAIIVVPVTRVGWLVVRWLRLGDVRFALVGVALLTVMGSALVLAH